MKFIAIGFLCEYIIYYSGVEGSEWYESMKRGHCRCSVFYRSTRN